MDEVIGWLVAGVGKDCGDCFEQGCLWLTWTLRECEPAF
jgi:bacterioferritin-associated ferredoxin